MGRKATTRKGIRGRAGPVSTQVSPGSGRDEPSKPTRLLGPDPACVTSLEKGPSLSRHPARLQGAGGLKVLEIRNDETLSHGRISTRETQSSM